MECVQWCRGRDSDSNLLLKFLFSVTIDTSPNFPQTLFTLQLRCTLVNNDIFLQKHNNIEIVNSFCKVMGLHYSLIVKNIYSNITIFFYQNYPLEVKNNKKI